MKKIIWFSLFIFSQGVFAVHPGLTIEDMVAMKRVGVPKLSQDGKFIVFSVKELTQDKKRFDSDLWVLELKTANLHQITHTPRSEGSYQWYKDHKSILFSRDKVIWLQPLNGGKATRLAQFPYTIRDFKLAPDGNRLVFSARVKPKCGENNCETKVEDGNGRLFKQLFVRHWDKWSDGKRSHLFLTTLKNPEKITDITLGWNADVPSMPFGGAEEYAISADGSKVYFSAKKEAGKESWSTNFDIFVYDIKEAKTTNLTEQNKAWDAQPVISHDGTLLAYLAMETPGYESDRFILHIINLDTGQRSVVAKDWDRSVSSFAFSEDDSSLIVSVQDVGNKNIFKIDLRTNKIKKLTHHGKNGSFDLYGNTLLYLHNDFTKPNEIYRMPLSGGKPQQLTFFNKASLSKIQMGAFQQFSFKGWNGEKVFGYIVKPINFNPKRKYPMTFLIHGGPQGSFYNQFHYRWNPQIYSAQGYVSVMVDFHGSTGYGKKFTDSIQNDWGGKPLVDLQRGLKAVTKKYKYIDTKNACALGASYGGYMINWIESHWYDQFKCLVNHDGVFDNRMMYFSTEELWFPEREHKGPYFDRVSNYERFNPVNFVKSWKTPMFVIQGGHDYRIPETQSLGAFTALQRQGIPSQLLYFPSENHWVLKPQNSIQWHHKVLDWLHKYLKNN